jgi:hypothetical protein
MRRVELRLHRRRLSPLIVVRESMSLRKQVLTRLAIYPGIVAASVFGLWAVSIRMPGDSHAGSPPPLTQGEVASSRLLREHVRMLAGQIGERNYIKRRALDSAAEYVRERLVAAGYEVSEQVFPTRGQSFRNLEATLPGAIAPAEIIVVGGHYDSVLGSPGADDNASGTAAVLELARLLRSARPDRTIRFVAFANEEPPFFFTDSMGSRHYARAARARGDDIVTMLSIETIGYYRDSAGSQQYPPVLGWFYPDRGNFVGFVGNVSSRGLVHRAISDFRSHTAFASAGTAAWMRFPGISWSDQWSFWKEGYDGIMITDTAPFRNPNYHHPWDVPDSLHYDHMARVVHGVSRTVLHLASTTASPK